MANLNIRASQFWNVELKSAHTNTTSQAEARDWHELHVLWLSSVNIAKWPSEFCPVPFLENSSSQLDVLDKKKLLYQHCNIPTNRFFQTFCLHLLTFRFKDAFLHVIINFCVGLKTTEFAVWRHSVNFFSLFLCACTVSAEFSSKQSHEIGPSSISKPLGPLWDTLSWWICSWKSSNWTPSRRWSLVQHTFLKLCSSKMQTKHWARFSPSLFEACIIFYMVWNLFDLY